MRGRTHHGLVAVTGVQLHADLAVHAGFALGMIVLTALTGSHVVLETHGTVVSEREKDGKRLELFQTDRSLLARTFPDAATQIRLRPRPGNAA